MKAFLYANPMNSHETIYHPHAILASLGTSLTVSALNSKPRPQPILLFLSMEW